MNPTEPPRPDDQFSALRCASRETWDILIIGAGPAGSMAAALLAANGKKVLLIEKSTWPREKVCGGCLNASAVQALASAGLGSSFRDAQPITRAVWHVGKKSLEMSAPGGVAIFRPDLDAALVTVATQRGCTFLPNTVAKLLPAESLIDHRIIQLRSAGIGESVRAKMVLTCDGIAGSSVDDEPWAKWRIQPRAWIGVSTTCPDSAFDCHAGAIQMHIGHGGYVGAVRVLGDQIHLAAALDPNQCRQSGGPALLIEKILYSSGHRAFPNLQTQHFRGTPGMTRRREQLGAHRVLAVGDACGYVEPFTGEGIAWAIHSAMLAVNLLPATDDWPTDLAARWTILHHDVIRQKQHWCRALRPLVHHPTMAALAISSARIFPPIAHFISRQICESRTSIPAHFQGALG